MKKLFWLPILLTLFWLVVAAIVNAATSGEPTAEEVAARGFCDAFLAGDRETYEPLLTAQMKAALTPAATAQIRASLEVAHGEARGTRAARWADTVQGFRRYRIPIEFERGVLDMQLAIDGDGKVAGMFFVPHETVEGEPAPAAAPRAQDPRPPFPYRALDVTFDAGGFELAGTLTVPRAEGPFPAVVLLSGSGPQNRDEEVFGHRPFLVLADDLTRAGVAVLRFDDRGVGASGGNLAQATSADFANDALAAVRFLRSRDEIDPVRIGLLGHSEGGLVAPLAAERSGDVAFLVLLAAPGLPGAELLRDQSGAFLRAAGMDDERVAAAEKAHAELTRRVVAGQPAERVGEAMAALKKAQGDDSPPSEAEIAPLLTPWMKFFLEYDPRPALRATKVPVLALTGALDLQVDADRNLGAIREALAENPDATVEKIPRLNHLFQTAQRGTIDEYGTIEETFAPAALETIRAWILKRFGGTER